MIEKKLISIHLNSNNPENFEKLILSLVKNTENIELVEIIVSIDLGDKSMKDTIKKFNRKYSNFINYIETDLIKTFADAWKPLNLLLEETSSTVKFISCISDNLRFETKGWDKIILSYDNYYKDNIFRIRCSKYRNETYQDIWDCGYKPDAYSFYSMSWLKITKIWNPCIGPDTFQECVSFYMKMYGDKFNRNLIENNIEFSGQEVSSELNLKTRIQRTRIYYKAFFLLMSYKNQKIANDKAYDLVSAISDIDKNKILISKKLIISNFFRRFNFFYYRGSPNHFIDSKIKNIIFFIWCYINIFDSLLIKIIYYINNKNLLDKFIKNKKQAEHLKNIINHE